MVVAVGENDEATGPVLRVAGGFPEFSQVIYPKVSWKFEMILLNYAPGQHFL